MEPVRTHRAKSVVDAARLHRARDRRERGLTLVEGSQLLADVQRAGAEVIEVFSTEDIEGAMRVDDRALSRLAGTQNPRGPVAVVKLPVEWLDRSRNLLVSIGVSDPGNVGTMIRTAAAFNWGFAYMQGSADPWAPKTIRAGGAGQWQTSIARISGPGDIGDWTTVATIVNDGERPDQIHARPVALLIGEEAAGLEEWVVESTDHTLTIPTPGPTESLNAAVAAAVAMHALDNGSGQSRTGV